MEHLISNLEDFDWSSDPKSLREAYVRTDFDSIFVKLITADVIKILSPQQIAEPHNLVYDDGIIQENLIGPLVKFICNLDTNTTPDDVSQTLEHIQTLNQPSKLCRRIIKSGDVTFSCNDCGLDGTCVICIDCFHKSAHKDHNYRMHNSPGGGCCDCGDVEAWKQNYACTDHMDANQTNLTLSDFEDMQLRAKQILNDKKACIEKIRRLPKNIAAKYFLVCQASLHYARMLLTWKDNQRVPQCLRIDNNNDPKLEELSKTHSSKNYFTVLFNDEVHTYDQVIGTLVKVLDCTKMKASIMASTISREGRSLIHNDTLEACKYVKEAIAQVRDSDSLKVEVIHGAVLAHQAFALKLLAWIQEMSSLCDAFRILTAYTLLGSYSPIPDLENESSGNVTLMEKVMLSNTTYWKVARVEWNDLFVTTMLTEYSIKEQFARLLTRIYPKLMEDFIQDDHDHSVSILTMTTQLYTVPSLICMLLEEENALTIISQTFIKVCRNTKRENPAISFENRNTFDMSGLKRGFYIIEDLKHLINVEPTKWTEKLRQNVIEAVKIFLELLDSMQGMDSVKRQLGQHLEYEPDWESGMKLQGSLTTFVTRLIAYCRLDEEVLVSALKDTQVRLFKNGGYKMANKELLGHQVSCIQYDVATSPVSVHLPLTRFAAALIFDLMRRRPSDKIPYDESLVIVPSSEPEGKGGPKHSMIGIMEPSLRTAVMIAQFRANMWRRNGYSLVNQLYNYHHPEKRKEMFDRDILVLQECAAMCKADEFMVHLLNKFQLFNWVSFDTIRGHAAGQKPTSYNSYNEEEVLAQTMSLGEEFLQLLLTIVGERYRVGVGIIEEDDVIKNEIIQLLCISPSTRSDLTSIIDEKDRELDCIKAVANLKRSTESSTGRYELKDEYYNRFNPFYYHYSRREQSEALDAQLKRKKNLKEPLLCCPPPKPVELTKQFSNLNELLKSDITLLLLKKILTRALGSSEDSQESSTKAPMKFVASDLQLDQSLHLIGLGLYEQERDPLGFGYLQAAHEKEIFVLMKDCHEKAKRSKDLIFWLMKKTNELIGTLNNDFSGSLDESTSNIIASIKDCFKPALSACDTMKEDSRKRNSELAAQRRDRIMAMMKANQDKFLSSATTKQLVAETEKTESASPNMSIQSNVSAQTASSSSKSSLPTFTTRSGRKSKPPKSFYGCATSTQDKTTSHVINKGTSTNPAFDEEELMDYMSDDQMEDDSMNVDEQSDDHIEPLETSHLCILCRGEQKIGFNQPTMILLAYIQRSAVLSKNRGERRIPNYALTPSNQLKYQSLTQPRSKQGNSPDMYSFTSDNSWSFDATFMPSDLFFGPHVSTCGHAMHYDCWQGFFEAIVKRETSRANRNVPRVSFELDKYEILCPLCECISNAAIPLLPNYTKFVTRRNRKSTIFATSYEVIEKSSENLSSCLHALRGAVDMFKHIRHIKEVSKIPIRLLQPKGINEVLEELKEVEALGLRDFIKSIRGDIVSSSSCTKSLLGSISSLAERIHSVGLDLDKSITDVNHARIFMMTSWSISYTIQAFERVSRFKGTPLFEELESSKNLCLSSLLRFASSSMMTHQSDMMQSLLVRKLRYLLISEEHLSSSPCCLDIDAFEIFVSLFMLLQKLYAHIDDSGQAQSNKCQKGSDILSSSPGSWSSSSRGSETQSYAWTTRAYDHEYFRNLLHLMLILNTIQVTISLQNESADLNECSMKDENSPGSSANNDSASSSSGSSQKADTKDCLVLYNFYKEMIIASGHPNSMMPNVDDEFATKVKSRLLPFLRSCAVFLFHLSNIPPPDELRTGSAFFEGKEFLNPNAEVTGEFLDAQQSFSTSAKEPDIDSSATNLEFSAICHYLDLPDNFGLLLQCQEARHLARSWLRHSRVLILIKSALQDRDTDPSKVSLATAAERAQSLKKVWSSPSSLQTVATAVAATSSSASQPSPLTSSQISKTELMPVKFIRQPHMVNRLIDLPYDYSELVDKVSDFSCPSIKNEDSRTPTMCLVCGVMLCSQSYCCQRDLNDLASNYQQILHRQRETTQGSDAQLSQQQAGSNQSGPMLTLGVVSMMAANAVAPFSLMGSLVSTATGSGANLSSSSGSPSVSANAVIHQQLVGSCSYHAYECSGGVGVFLRVRNCQILLLSGRSKGSYMPAPYIDDHGETDFGLHRGNPLHLNRKHYEKLQQMWLTHAIPEQISRTLEYSAYASSINWHLH